MSPDTLVPAGVGQQIDEFHDEVDINFDAILNPTYFPYTEDLTIEDPATYERNLLIHRINTELVPQFEEAGKNRTVFHSYDIDVSDSEIGTLAKGDFSLKYLAADNQTVLGPSDETFIKDGFSTQPLIRDTLFNYNTYFSSYFIESFNPHAVGRDS